MLISLSGLHCQRTAALLLLPVSDNTAVDQPYYAAAMVGDVLFMRDQNDGLALGM